jgi:hypothetical protein
MRASSHCHKGREAYARRAWDEAYRALTLADAAQPLGGEDLELLATSAYLSGRDSEFLKAYERAHQAHLGAGFATRAARCAFWLALALFLRGETGRATGWLGRARRLVERTDCAERGYLLLPVVEQQLATGDFDGAYRAASNAAALGERFAEPDLVACGRHLQGRSLLHQGRVATGLALLDEAMIAVSAGELSPVMTGLLYCSVIQACQHFYALSRAREWTAALAQWCENGRLYRHLPRASRGGIADARRLARGHRRGAARLQALRPGNRSQPSWDCLLPGSGSASAPRRFRRSRSGVSERQSEGP